MFVVMNNNSPSPTASPEDIVHQTEILVKQLLQHTNENRENLTEESFALVRNVKQLAENCLKEKQHAAAVQLHVEQLEKIIVRLRSEHDFHTSPGIVGRTTPSKFSSILESEHDNLRILLEQANEKVIYLSGIVEEKDNVIGQLQEELDKRTTDLDTSCQILLTTQDNAAAADLAITTLDTQLKEAQLANETLLEQMQALESNFTSFQEDASRKIEELQGDIAQKQAAFDTLSASIATEDAAYRDILDQFNAHMTSGISVFADHVSDSLTSLVRGNERLVNLQRSVHLIQQALTERDHQLSVLSGELQSKETVFEAATNEAKLSRKYLLAKSDEVAEVRQRADALTDELSNVTVQKAELDLLLLSKEEELSKALLNLEEAQSKTVLLAEGFETMGEQVERYKTLSEKLRDDLASEQSKKSQLEAKILELEASSGRVADLLRIVESKESEIVDLKANFEAEQEKHEEEMTGLQRDIDTFQLRINDMDNLLPELHFQLTEAHRNRVVLTEQFEQSQKALSESEAKIEGLKLELAQKCSELDPVRSQMSEKDAKVEALTAELTENAGKISELDQLLRSQKSENESEIQTLTAELGRLRSELEDSQKAVSENEATIQVLTAELSENAGKLVELDNLRSQCEHLQSKIGVLTEQLVERNSEVDELGNRVQELEREVEIARNQLNSSQSETANQMSSLFEAKRDLEAKLAEEMRQKEEVENNFRVKSDELEQFKRLFKESEEIARGQVDELNRKFTEASNEIERLSSELKSSSNEIARLNHLLGLRSESATAEVDDLNSKLNQSRSEIERLFADSKTHSDEVERLRHILGQETEKMCHLNSEIERLSHDLKAFSEENSRLNSILEKRAESESAQICLLNEQIERLSSDLKASSFQVEELTQQLGQSSNEIGRLKALSEQNSEEIVQMTQKLSASEGENRTLIERAYFYEAEISKLAGLFSSFAQFADQKFAKIWDRLDSLIRRFFLLEKDANLLVESQRFLVGTLRDVKMILKQECPQLFCEVMTTIEPALSSLEQRLSGFQGNFSQLSCQIKEILSRKRENREISSQTGANLVDISELESLQDVLDQRDSEIGELTREIKRLSQVKRPIFVENEAQTSEKLDEEVEKLRRELEKRDEQLTVFSQELKKMHENERNLVLEHEKHVQSLQKLENFDQSVQTEEIFTAQEDVERLQAHLAYSEQQVQGAKQQILELMEEVKSYRDAGKRAERRFNEADQAARSLAQDSQNMAGIVASLREKLRVSEEKLSATEIARVQVVTQLAAIQSAYSAVPTPDQSAEIAAECDRLRNKVKFMTDQFELAVSRSALLERSLREKEGQLERLAQELGSERQRLLSFERESSPPPSALPSPSRENSHHAKVDLKQYFEALPVPVKRAFDRVRHSQAAVVTLSASQRFHRIVNQSPLGNAMRQFSITARHQILSKMSPAKVQFIVTVYVCFLHLLTIFYMFTCYGPPKMASLEAPPHLEVQNDI